MSYRLKALVLFLLSRKPWGSFLVPVLSVTTAWAGLASADPAPTTPTSLTVGSAVEEAKAHSPEFQRIQAMVDEASSRPLEALAGHLPRVTLAGTYLTHHKFFLFPINGASFEAPNPISTLGVNLSLNLIDGGQTTNAFRAARAINRAAEREAEYAALQLDHAVRLKFYQALSAQMLADVTDQNVKTLQDHWAKTKALLSGGATTKLDTLRVEVQLSEAGPDQIQAHDNVLIARKALAQVMGMEEDTRPLTGTLPAPDASHIPANLKLETARRGDLAAGQERADAAYKTRLTSYAPWLPKINFQAEYQYYNNRDNSLSSSMFEAAYSVGFGFTWALFDATNITRIQQASARQIQAEKTSEAALQKAPVEFETWKRRYLSNTALYRARTQAIESATESVRLARISYDAGSRTSTEVLDAELDLFRARAGVVRSALDSAEALLNLELALGHAL